MWKWGDDCDCGCSYDDLDIDEEIDEDEVSHDVVTCLNCNKELHCED